MENTSAPKRLRISAKGFENFTGPLGVIDFVDGVSVFPVPEPFASRLAASMEMVEVDENGDEAPTGIAHRLVAEAAMRAPVLEKLDVMTDAEKRQDTVDALKKKESDRKVHSRDELEALLEKEGVKAIRQIGNEWGVKHKVAVVLIEMILEKQSEHEADRQKRLEAAAGSEPALPIEPEVKPVVEAEVSEDAPEGVATLTVEPSDPAGATDAAEAQEAK